MIFGFTNSYRVIYLDGRKHTDPDIAISTYNGESIGHWEGDTLVVDTKYFETESTLDRRRPADFRTSSRSWSACSCWIRARRCRSSTS